MDKVFGGAIFDMDGTVTDSSSIWDGVTEKYMNRLGYPLPEDFGAKIAGKSFEGVMACLAELYQIRKTPRVMVMEMYAMVKEAYCAVPLKAGIEDYLKYLQMQNVPCAIATLAHPVFIQDVLGSHGLLPYFHVFVSAVELGDVTKREPTVFHRAAELLNAKPGDCVVFEDSLGAIETAKKASYYTVAVEDKKNLHLTDELINTADRYIRSFGELQEEPIAF